ncbi:MAG: PaaI family thioesterase [Bacillota bacterium]
MALEPENNMCFACSEKNPIGLKLKFRREGNEVKANFLVTPEHQGWPGYLHGGLVATICDEAMAQWMWLRGLEANTGELSVRFKHGIPVGTVVEVKAALTKSRGRLMILEASVLFPDGREAAVASGKFIRSDGEVE